MFLPRFLKTTSQRPFLEPLHRFSFTGSGQFAPLGGRLQNPGTRSALLLSVTVCAFLFSLYVPSTFRNRCGSTWSYVQGALIIGRGSTSSGDEKK
ncbi:hypothetical protein L596_018457 [Steinernema carpocapsae]|uniref:Uncharacterized protein n=1 Tax=Steinernema carpocapsae TaxID=34508 RepID=A0A4U5N5E4_STECR|nr:hypothetical protein L596_018457 [Steinernema carpocapsae]